MNVAVDGVAEEGLVAEVGRGLVVDVFTAAVVLEAGRVEVDDVVDLFLGVIFPAFGVGASLVGVDCTADVSIAVAIL